MTDKDLKRAIEINDKLKKLGEYVSDSLENINGHARFTIQDSRSSYGSSATIVVSKDAKDDFSKKIRATLEITELALRKIHEDEIRLLQEEFSKL